MAESRSASATNYSDQHAALSLFHDLQIDAQTVAAAEGAQQELAAQGQHRVSLPDLIVGACAQQLSAAVLRVNRHFDVLAQVHSFRSIRLPS